MFVQKEFLIGLATLKTQRKKCFKIKMLDHLVNLLKRYTVQVQIISRTLGQNVALRIIMDKELTSRY